MLNSVNDLSECLGCQLCADICPTKAITYRMKEDGHTIPVVNQEKCIDCGICKKKCVALHWKKEDKQENVIACVSRLNQKGGSSGGIFGELASKWISVGGYVCASAFNEDLKLKHIIINRQDEIQQLCKSKYIQSDCTDVYKQIKKLVSNNEKVLFVGCPCQVSALKNLCSIKERQNIVLVDFLCRGTPPQRVFDICRIVEENKIGGKLTSFQFRSKSRKAEHSFRYTYKKDNGKNYVKEGYAFEYPYYSAFLEYLILREGCYRCPYSTEERVGDITLGDFWKIEKYSKKFNSEKGCSMITLNTSVGVNVFNMIKDNLQLEIFPLEYASQNNESFIKPTTEDKDRRTLIREMFCNSSYEEVIEQCFKCKKILKCKAYAKCPKIILNVYVSVKGKIKEFLR